MRPTFCDCSDPKPRVEGVMRAVCASCEGEVRAKKKGEGGTVSDILTREQLAAEVKQIRRIIHGLNNRLEKLDDALNAN